MIALTRKVADNPHQVERLANIHTAISDRRDKVMEPVVSLRRDIGAAASLDKIVDLWPQHMERPILTTFARVCPRSHRITFWVLPPPHG
ncbi:MAG: CHASE3 domain-containing protein [Rhodobacteraceae bacterium]|nr:CHASE3 domain-containing protein [Paracoccaceae bacterium]